VFSHLPDIDKSVACLCEFISTTYRGLNRKSMTVINQKLTLWGSVVIQKIIVLRHLRISDWAFRGSYPSRDKRLFSSTKTSILALGPSSLLFSGFLGSFRGRKLSECDFDHLTSSDAEDKNEWSYTHTPPIHLHGVDMDRYTFYHSSCIWQKYTVS
jgi:hypothetical protein